MAAAGLNPLLYYEDVRRFVTTTYELSPDVSDSVIAARWNQDASPSCVKYAAFRLLDDLGEFQDHPNPAERAVLLNRTVEFLEDSVDGMQEELFPLDRVIATYRALPGTRSVIALDSELADLILPLLTPGNVQFPYLVPAHLQRSAQVGFRMTEEITRLMNGSSVEDFVVAAFSLAQRLPQPSLRDYVMFLVCTSCAPTLVREIARFHGTPVQHDQMHRLDYMALWVGTALWSEKVLLGACFLEWFGMEGAALAVLEADDHGNPLGANHLQPTTNTAGGWASAVRNFLQRYKRSVDHAYRLRRANEPLKLTCSFFYDKAKILYPQYVSDDCANHFTKATLLAHLNEKHRTERALELVECQICHLPQWKCSENRTLTEQLCLGFQHDVNCYPKNPACLDTFVPTPSAALDAFHLPNIYMPPAVPHEDFLLQVSRPRVYRRNNGSMVLVFRTYVQ